MPDSGPCPQWRSEYWLINFQGDEAIAMPPNPPHEMGSSTADMTVGTVLAAIFPDWLTGGLLYRMAEREKAQTALP